MRVPIHSSLLALWTSVQIAHAVPAGPRAVSNGYAPVSTPCPSAALVRTASGINAPEATYVASRKAIADAALISWLDKISNTSAFGTASLPSIGLVLSGGGYRALLNEAGILQAFDARERETSVSGLYQAFTYQTALSGGGWFANSLAAQNWPTVSYLQKTIYEPNFAAGLLVPDNIGALSSYGAIVSDIVAKADAGYNVSLADVYGRLLGYNLFTGADGGVSLKMSSLTSFSNFTAHNVPFPIITSIGTDLDIGQCTTTLNATQYEYSPYEFGSWDDGVNAFTQTAFLGSKLSNGVPSTGSCTANFDNLGFITASTSNVFPGLCYLFPVDGNPDFSLGGVIGDLAQALEVLTWSHHLLPIEADSGCQDILVKAAEPVFDILFNEIPNPFRGFAHSYAVSESAQLTLGDGGLSSQNDPIWPLIQPSRNVDVLVVTDIGGDNVVTNYATGGSLVNTYNQAQAHGLTKMPFIPSTDVFASENLTMRAQFFGCYEQNTVTLVWIPLASFTYISDTSGAQLEYPVSETDGIIGNGNAIATQNGDSEWPTCLACAIMKKSTTTLPSECQACFSKYCYAQS
ncbi:hypothetical protein LTR85_008182 [Meristemomyces frigidus]|nr:hypothetical protein LTR85_008182 [Meristemomyces frigidus]